MTNYRRRKKPNKNLGPKYNVNKRIRADQVRLITQEGDNLGVMSAREALNIAMERGLDLVEINPNSKPPVAKVMDWSKFKYQQSKSGTTKSKEKKLKTIRVSVRIAPHDLEVQVRKCDQFLEKGHQVKLQVQMKGREKAHPEVAEEVIKDLISQISIDYEIGSEIKKTGDSYYATIQPVSR